MAQVIVTSNLRDFPREALTPLGIEAQSPDEFVLNLLDLAPAAVVSAFEKQLASLKNPPVTREQLLDTFVVERSAASGCEAAGALLAVSALTV